MTLKEFAEQNEIGYNLAKQWKARGKIVTDGDGYRLVTAQPRSQRVTAPSVTCDSVTGESVTAVTDPSVTAVTAPRIVAHQPAGNRTLRRPAGSQVDADDLVALTDRVTALETENRELRAQAETNAREIAALRLALASLNGENRELRERVTVIDSTLWDAIDRHGDLLETISDDMATLRGQIGQSLVTPGQSVIKRNGRTEIVDSDFLESQKWAE